MKYCLLFSDPCFFLSGSKYFYCEFYTLQFVEIYNPVGGLTKNSYASLDSYLLRAVTVLGLKLIALVLCSQYAFEVDTIS